MTDIFHFSKLIHEKFNPKIEPLNSDKIKDILFSGSCDQYSITCGLILHKNGKLFILRDFFVNCSFEYISNGVQSIYVLHEDDVHHIFGVISNGGVLYTLRISKDLQEPYFRTVFIVLGRYVHICGDL